MSTNNCTVVQWCILPAPTKEVWAEEGDSCSVLSLCFWKYSCILNMCVVRRHQNGELIPDSAKSSIVKSELNIIILNII